MGPRGSSGYSWAESHEGRGWRVVCKELDSTLRPCSSGQPARRLHTATWWELEEDGGCEQGDAEIWLGSQDLLGVSLEPAMEVEAVATLGRRRTPGVTGMSSFIICAVLGGGGSSNLEAVFLEGSVNPLLMRWVPG